jgi:very-short-patch-repair endonuclease
MPTKNPSTSLRAGIICGQRVTKEKVQRAKELRRNMTPAEKILWNELRANKLGVHFRRQQVIAGFIVDFYCHKADLVIEVDGSVHEKDEQKESDAERDKVLSEMGLRVFRFKNEDIIGNLRGVLEKIRELISE